MRKHLGAAALFLLLAVAMTWPLARCLDRCVAYPGDPYINTWILDWDWYAAFHQPLSLFQANAFYPARYSLAFSENLFGIALLAFPFRAAGFAPLTTYNLMMLAGFAFAGFAAYLLGWQVTRSWVAGVAAGICYAYVPFRFTHLSHLQHIWSGWLPLLIVALLHYARRPSWPRAALFGAVFLMNGLTNIHWLLFGSMAIALTMPIVVRRWLPLLASLLVAGALLLPFLLPYWQMARLYGAQRNWQEAKGWSAQPRDWLNPGVGNRLYRNRVDAKVDPERWLFPGVLSLVLCAVALLERGAGSPAGPDRLRAGPTFTVAAVWILLGFIGSLGLHTVFHRFLFTYVPGFRAIRVPARWAAIAYVGIAILVAVAVAAIARRQRWVAAVVPLLFILELRAAPIRWYPAAPRDPQVYMYLRDHQTGPIAEVPIDEGGSDYGYLLRATRHHQPIVNGVSGFVPPELIKLSTMWSASPIGDDFVDELQRIGVRTLVVHADLLGGRDKVVRDWLRRELDRGRIGFVRRFTNGIQGDWLFTIGGGLVRPAELETFLSGGFTYSDATFGVLDFPRAGERLPREGAQFSGWALSPHGIREVNLLFDNGGVRLPTRLIEDEGLKGGFPWYPNVPRPRFVAPFRHRPRNIRSETDVQVEIVDGRGERTLLEGSWIDWP
ncbi:MAG TPA: hypothetical protein VGR02_02560 [Thermoanaerobaculia bacterium]|nr:hypothetical protein [Thermoanaerobaculia bacterium]